MAAPLAGCMAPRPKWGRNLTLLGRRTSRQVRLFAALSALLTGSLPLSGCTELIVGTAATTGVAIAEERSVGDAVDDLTIRAELNHLFFQDDVELYRNVSFSVFEGRVLLKGSVTTLDARIHALRVAWQAAGVREVINELQVSDEGGVLDYARDTWISAQLKGRLLVDGDVLSINYSVETVNGTVYLIGIAQDEEELVRVIEHARGIEDVKRVVSHVVVKDDRRRPVTP